MQRLLFRSLAAAVLVSCGVALAECGGGGGGNSPGDATLGDGTTFGEGSTITGLTIQPQNPTVPVTITDGVVSATPITFTALANGGAAVSASFSLDKGELGNLAAGTGVFTASGNVGGVGTVTAVDPNASGADGGPLSASTSLTVTIAMSQNGKPQQGDGGTTGGSLGGNNGVGGNDYGGPIDSATKAVLDGPATAPASAAELGFLYPYDRTVWPQGILAPLLQWQTTHASATTAVKIHLAEKGFTFDGYYAAPGWVNEPIDQAAWSKALYGNQGDPLEVDLYITDGKTSWGPITEHWVVARGVLQGTVYYNSYNSQLTGSGNGTVLAIKPGAVSPTLAIPGSNTDCHVCHEVSANGGTLVMMDHTYTTEGSYDLTKNGAPIQSYSGTAPDGTSNSAKFVWSGVYPDGTFAMTSSTHTVVYSTLNSDLYSLATGNHVTYGGAIQETGWTNVVTQAVTPAFSPDGLHLAFNFWSGPGDGTTVARGGHSLDMMDFDCGAGTVDGGTPVQCGGTTYAFGNLRELYYDATRFVGWPAFTPDAKGIVFHDAIKSGSSGWADDQISTWSGAQAELWYTDTGLIPQPVRMNQLNGLDATSTSYLPTNGSHPNDTILNYEPTVNPLASGGYFWVVFTSRRMYGNVATGDPYSGYTGQPIPKKLWVAAVDINPKAGTDPSHPAFYLPGQELNAGNSRGYWVVDPCKPNGNSCVTGDECCNGFCRQGDAGLVCSDNTGGCAQQYEACTKDSDCCAGGVQLGCVNGHCAQKSPN